VPGVFTGASGGFLVKLPAQDPYAPQSAWGALKPLFVRAWGALHVVVAVALLFEVGKPWNPVFIFVLPVLLAWLAMWLIVQKAS
jgi:hypothetical protein